MMNLEKGITDIRWKLRFENLKKAFARLEEACVLVHRESEYLLLGY